MSGFEQQQPGSGGNGWSSWQDNLYYQEQCGPPQQRLWAPPLDDMLFQVPCPGGVQPSAAWQVNLNDPPPTCPGSMQPWAPSPDEALYSEPAASSWPGCSLPMRAPEAYDAPSSPEVTGSKANQAPQSPLTAYFEPASGGRRHAAADGAAGLLCQSTAAGAMVPAPPPPTMPLRAPPVGPSAIAATPGLCQNTAIATKDGVAQELAAKEHATQEEICKNAPTVPAIARRHHSLQAQRQW
eukprot:NODE_15323_length_1056_cov_3.121636.p1 GENE.NODE_15323_length_1056_cov_3.121636~~NODE_15323_length_1056_cov_3.121636.p1  ORF type:complete len:255 (-),score=67.91 NODE_15323_length_1056_cov_3.121636:292-1008(-)